MGKNIFTKILIVFLVLTFGIQKQASAQQNEIEALQAKVERLQNKISQLESRVARMEKLLLSGEAVNLSSQKVVDSDGWKNKQNWRKLEKGMSKTEVRQLLGEPGKINASSYGDTWYYPDVLGGRVSFDKGRVSGWREP